MTVRRKKDHSPALTPQGFRSRAGRRLIETVLGPIHELTPSAMDDQGSEVVWFEGGLKITGSFPDKKRLLDSALEDIANFFEALHLLHGVAQPSELILDRTLEEEEHKILVSKSGVKIVAADVEGVRRSLAWIQAEMCKWGGPGLPRGEHHRKACIKTRLSRCFFGPINRPPGNHDELMDDINYYPDAYLNRLAHDGVNALWLTIKFRDSVPSKLFPEFAPDSERRLSKLRETVTRCARYGIRVFVFCIEPECLPLDSPILARHPELRGHVIDFQAAFCTSSKLGKAYLVEASKTLFKKVPDLGGMIVIPVGERFTQCSSIALPESGTTNEACNCPRCSLRSPHDVLSETLEGLRSGMNSANPKAELIAWPYGQLIMWGKKATLESATRIPKGVILQHNFESGGTNQQLGKPRPLCDYWLSVVGPSPVFRETAQAATANGNRMSAKLQVGCSHENATVPFVPVPGLLYSKYQALHKLGVSAVMQSWYFGTYPSLMTRAAGLLSFSPLPKTEDDFLLQLAQPVWGDESHSVVKAWKLFRLSYENYPSTHLFGYYGPVQDGVVWPLHLIPRNRPLAPTWKLGYPASGDYLADCLSSEFQLKEVVTLCAHMAALWKEGLGHLQEAYMASAPTRSRQFEWNVARAVGLQFESASEIMRFYLIREKLAETTGTPALHLLDEMESIVSREIARRLEMIELCKAEPTLGFHSEAEGFKFSSGQIRSGLGKLKGPLIREFAQVRESAINQEALFPHYTGKGARNPLVFERSSESPSWSSLDNFLTQNSPISGKPLRATPWSASPLKFSPLRVRFQASLQRNAVVINIEAMAPDAPASALDAWIPRVIVDIEPRRLHPRIQFSVDAQGNKTTLIDDGYLMIAQLPFRTHWRQNPKEWSASLSIPLRSARLGRDNSLFRFNLRVQNFQRATNECHELSWARRRPLQPRQAWDDGNPATDYDWARLDVQ